MTGVACGERYDRARRHSGTAIEAVTYHKFSVKQSGGEWIAEVFLDL